MNLIGNSCVASFITRDCIKTDFKNPFCWCKMDFESVYNLISKFDQIDFKNVEFTKKDNYYIAKIDNLVEVQYIHYIEDPEVVGIKYEKSNVVSNEILKYVKDKYFSRLSKMVEEPTFLLAAGYWQEYYLDDEQIEKLMDLNSKYPIIISMPNSVKNRIKSKDNVKILNHNFKMGIDGVHKKIAYYIANYFWGLKGEEASQALDQ